MAKLSIRAAMTIASGACALLLAPVIAAQEPMTPPPPAPELQKLARFVGNWEGSGECLFGSDGTPTSWTGRGTYRWSHNKYFLQEDFEIAFENHPAPMVTRAYIGWDPARKGYSMARIWNDGRAELHDLRMLPDGSLCAMTVGTHGDAPYAERSIWKLDAGKLVHSIDVLGLEGDSVEVVDAEFATSSKSYEAPLDAKPFEGAAPAVLMRQLARLGGTYDVQGSMVMSPGMPAMKIKGIDVFRPIFGGTVIHDHTDGSAEGMPGAYEADAYYAYDTSRNCIVCVGVSNQGEIMRTECRFTGDDRNLICNTTGVHMGQPMATQFVLELDEKGAARRGACRCIMGTSSPFEGFTATYTKK